MEHVWRDKLDTRESIAQMIKSAPTIEVEPIKHRKWQLRYVDFATGVAFKCCPNCGAKMTEGED